MMRWIYILVVSLVFIRLAFMPPTGEAMQQGIAEQIFAEAEVPNSIAGILLRNRLYDTVFEVFVFMLAVLGVQYAFSFHSTAKNVFYLRDATMIILARIGAMVAALVFLELAVRGHLAPGGGFAAGVAGGTAIVLVSLTDNIHTIHTFYKRWHIASIEKCIVILVLLVAVFFMLLPSMQFGEVALSVIAIPVLNMLIAVKVAIGSWTIALLFLRHRGLV